MESLCCMLGAHLPILGLQLALLRKPLGTYGWHWWNAAASYMWVIQTESGVIAKPE